MNKVAFVRESRQKGYKVLGIVIGEVVESYTIKRSTYEEMGTPSRASLIDGEALEIIKKEDECFRALRRALSILSYADNSKSTLKLKLYRAGFSRDAINFALEDCIKNGYIDENKQLLRLVSSIANGKLRGPLYIRRYLLSKGYSIGDINSAIDELVDSGEVDFDEIYKRLIEKTGTEDSDGRRALAYKWGFRGNF